jgi:hypothetical protein
MPYPQIYPPDGGEARPALVVRTMFANTVDRGVAETIVEYLRAPDATMRAAQVRCWVGRWPVCRPRPPRSPTAGLGSW